MWNQPGKIAGKMLTLRELVAPVLQKSRRGIDNCVYQTSKGMTPLSQSIFDPLNLDTFECNGKHLWMDLKSGWCHLCQEPIGIGFVHISDRDHITLFVFLHLYVNYPRHWLPETVMNSAQHRYSVLHRFATAHTSVDHLHTMDDAKRRGELQALLVHLTGRPQGLVTVLQGTAPGAFFYSGERMFKINISKLCAVMFPPMAPGVFTQFTHKCWGRTNLERMYDALNIADVQQDFGCEPRTSKDGKAAFMRMLFWELQSAAGRDDIDEVTRMLVMTAKRRLSFECIFLCSMHFMNRIFDVVRLLEYPSPDMLQQMGMT